VSTEFYGGMVIYALMYWWLIIPATFGFAITLIITISRIFRNGLTQNKVSAIIHGFGLTVISVIFLINSKLFKSETLLEAILIDDLSAITIKLRTDNTFDTRVDGMFGFVEKLSGDYHLEQDTIVFHQPPYSNDFIPNKIIIDKSDSAIYFNRLANGEFDRTKSFVNYFEIRKMELE
jgi:hypothetical protein